MTTDGGKRLIYEDNFAFWKVGLFDYTMLQIGTTSVLLYINLQAFLIKYLTYLH